MRNPTLLAALLLFPGMPALAQGEIKPFPPVDPYTKNAPEAIEAAGYLSFGPFRFGDDHTTDQIVTTLGGIPLLFVETAHFRLGCGLPEYTVSDAIEKNRLKDELERLAARLPSVKTKLKKLDPWLRMHLYAQRLEELYTDFQEDFGLHDEDFPAVPPDPKKRPTGPYMGEGRYLGMTSKFNVLVFAKKSAVGRYSSVYLGQALQTPTRWYLPGTDAFLFITCAEFLEGDYANDSALACDVISGVAQNLAMGFRSYRVGLAFSVSEGIGHVYSRRFDERYHIFSGLDPTQLRIKAESNWAPSVRARVEHAVYPELDTMLGWTDAEALDWAEHLMLWSRLDHVLAREDGLAGRLLRLLKEPTGKTTPPTTEELVARAKKAFQEASGKDLAALDQDWAQWVLATYPKK